MNSAHEQCLKQCTESKLSRVHDAPIHSLACEHTAPCHGPSPAVSQRMPGRVAAQGWSCPDHRRPYHCAHACTTTPCRALCHATRSRYKNCIATLASAVHRVVRLQCVSQGAGHCIGALATLYRDPKSPPQPRYKILYHDPPLAKQRARAAACSYARPAVS